MIVNLLGNMSDIFGSFATPCNNSDTAKAKITDQTSKIYQTLSDIAINLRKEVKILDDNIGVFDKNDENVMILPIPVDQKNTALGKRRTKEEINQLMKLIPEEPTEDQKFIQKTETKTVDKEHKEEDTTDNAGEKKEPETEKDAVPVDETKPDIPKEAQATQTAATEDIEMKEEPKDLDFEDLGLDLDNEEDTNVPNVKQEPGEEDFEMIE